MSHTRFSFVIDHAAAVQAFRQTDVKRLLLAVLAGVPPEAAWTGCLLYEGESPIAEGKTVCIGAEGPGAEQVQRRVVEACERLGITVLEIYEGGPESRTAIARASVGRWEEP